MRTWQTWRTSFTIRSTVAALVFCQDNRNRWRSGNRERKKSREKNSSKARNASQKNLKINRRLNSWILYIKELKWWFLAPSVWQQIFSLHSRLAIQQWSLVPDKKFCAASLPNSPLLNPFVYTKPSLNFLVHIVYCFFFIKNSTGINEFLSTCLSKVAIHISQSSFP
jgi:hypothetical protein